VVSLPRIPQFEHSPPWKSQNLYTESGRENWNLTPLYLFRNRQISLPDRAMLFPYLIQHHDVKTYDGAEVSLGILLTSAPDGREGSTSGMPGTWTPGKELSVSTGHEIGLSPKLAWMLWRRIATEFRLLRHPVCSVVALPTELPWLSLSFN
jgi:hypothetical protein